MNHTNLNQMPSDVSSRIVELLSDLSKPIKLELKESVGKIVFADGQRIILNFNHQTGRIWLAGKSVAAEFELNGSQWLSSQDGSELFDVFTQLINEITAGNELNQVTGKLTIIDYAKLEPLFIPQNFEPARRKISWFYIAVILLMFFFGYRYMTASKSVPDSTAASAEMSQVEPAIDDTKIQCDAKVPQNGTSKSFVAMTGNPNNKANITLVNEHSHDLFVIFTKPNSAIPLHAVYVRARNQTLVAIDPSAYELMFSIGKKWCNLQIGFQGGQISKLNHRFELTQQIPIAVSFQSTGSEPAQFQVFMHDQQKKMPEPPAINIVSEGVVELQQNADGHYYIPGTINGAPLLFMIDTGASITTLKRDIALAGGIRDCRAAKLNTANGVVEACIGLMPELRIGPYIINNAEVASNPNTEVNLLGMNVLSQFQINTEKGVMRLTKQ
jgi:clan AA aspartic protease (TIGR02281 family)